MAFRRLSPLIGNRWIMYQSIDIFSNKLLKSSGALEMSFHNFHFYILQYFFTAPTWLSISNDFGIQLSILLNILSEHYQSERPQQDQSEARFQVTWSVTANQRPAALPLPSKIIIFYILPEIIRKLKVPLCFLGSMHVLHTTHRQWTNQRPVFRSHNLSGPEFRWQLHWFRYLNPQAQ